MHKIILLLLSVSIAYSMEIQREGRKELLFGTVGSPGTTPTSFESLLAKYQSPLTLSLSSHSGEKIDFILNLLAKEETDHLVKTSKTYCHSIGSHELTHQLITRQMDIIDQIRELKDYEKEKYIENHFKLFVCQRALSINFLLELDENILNKLVQKNKS